MEENHQNKAYRLAIKKCQNCYHQKTLCGQAFTPYNCKNCHKNHQHPNTCVPKICPECSDNLKQCSYCLNPMD